MKRIIILRNISKKNENALKHIKIINIDYL